MSSEAGPKRRTSSGSFEAILSAQKMEFRRCHHNLAYSYATNGHNFMILALHVAVRDVTERSILSNWFGAPTTEPSFAQSFFCTVLTDRPLLLYIANVYPAHWSNILGKR
ncbi:unnamed protein product [Protopolystoma xenopodis]|uniref:Uncharacterized protein n=1 Tax=Protopolystoma xenopodis TaxID=117903 RepID=A0A448X4Z2_9PLAT|nr:unnamed protein product [Protopolystoma xenopodis]